MNGSDLFFFVGFVSLVTGILGFLGGLYVARLMRTQSDGTASAMRVAQQQELLDVHAELPEQSQQELLHVAASFLELDPSRRSLLTTLVADMRTATAIEQQVQITQVAARNPRRR